MSLKREIDKISFFNSMPLSLEKLHDVQELQRELFDVLHTIVDGFVKQDNGRYNPLNLRAANAIKASARDSFVKVNNIVGDEGMAFSFISSTIGEFARYSCEKFGIGAILRNSALDDLITNKAAIKWGFRDKFIAIDKELSVFNHFDKNWISKTSDEYFVGYFVALSNIHNLLDGDIKKAYQIVSSRTKSGNEEAPCPIISQHRLYPLVADKFNLPPK